MYNFHYILPQFISNCVQNICKGLQSYNLFVSVNIQRFYADNVNIHMRVQYIIYADKKCNTAVNSPDISINYAEHLNFYERMMENMYLHLLCIFQKKFARQIKYSYNSDHYFFAILFFTCTYKLLRTFIFSSVCISVLLYGRIIFF